MFSRQTYEFAFWGIIIVLAGMALLMYQHATHTSAILTAIAGRFGDISQTGANLATAAAIEQNIGPPIVANSPATGVWSPIGPDELSTPLSYTPSQNQ